MPARPWVVRSSVVASQVDIHREWGGVVPELASRQHIRDICGVVERAMGDAAVTAGDLGAIAVTQGPGLVGSLLVGVSFAKALAASWNLPLVPVHHLAGHIESLFLQHGPLPLPAMVLVVSGGHTSLYDVRAPGEYRAIGRTRDDAAGRGLRQGGETRRPRLSGRAGDRPPGEDGRRPRRAPSRRADDASRSQRAAAERAVGLQLQRPEDRRAPARSCAGRRVGAVPRRNSPTCARAFSGSSSTPSSTRRSRPRAGVVREASASPAGFPPTAAFARTLKRRGSGPVSRSTCRRWRSRPTTPR